MNHEVIKRFVIFWRESIFVELFLLTLLMAIARTFFVQLSIAD